MPEQARAGAVSDRLAQYRAARDAAAGIALDRAVARVSGPEATAYLQGQLSQDVTAMAMGQAAWSLLLAPAGRVDALVRVTRRGDDEFLLDTDAGWGDVVDTRLTRFKLRTRVDIEPLAWRLVALRGPAVPEPQPTDGGPVVVPGGWRPLVGAGPDGFDVLGPAPAMPAGTVELDASVYDALRIQAGIPAMGAELTEKTIPEEAGIVEATVSFTKGCYTGQELVARIDSRGGHVARRLRGLRLAAPVDPSAPLELDGKSVGWVTSVAESPALGWIGLGYVARAVTPPAEVTVAGGAVAQVFPLPLAPE